MVGIVNPPVRAAQRNLCLGAALRTRWRSVTGSFPRSSMGPFPGPLRPGSGAGCNSAVAGRCARPFCSPKMNRRHFIAAIPLAAAAGLRSQNVVDGAPAGATGKAQPLPDNLIDALLAQRPVFKPAAPWQHALDEWLAGHP